MIIGTTQITTPFEDELRYDADWRHVVATAMFENPSVIPDIPEISSDVFVMDYLTFLQKLGAVGDDGAPLVRDYKFRLYAKLRTWFGDAATNSVRYHMEPLLLTEATYDVIAKDMSGGALLPNVIELYEKLFFNVRNGNGACELGSSTKTFFALGDRARAANDSPEDALQRAIACQLGYAGLMYVWRWRDCSGPLLSEHDLQKAMMQLAQSNLCLRGVRGDMNNFDLNTMQAQYVNYRRLQAEEAALGKGDSGDLGEHTDLMLQMVQTLLKLPLPEGSQSKATLEGFDEQWEAKRSAHQSVSSQTIEDEGAVAGEEKLTSMMNDHFTQT